MKRGTPGIFQSCGTTDESGDTGATGWAGQFFKADRQRPAVVPRFIGKNCVQLTSPNSVSEFNMSKKSCPNDVEATSLKHSLPSYKYVSLKVPVVATIVRIPPMGSQVRYYNSKILCQTLSLGHTFFHRTAPAIIHNPLKRIRP